MRTLIPDTSSQMASYGFTSESFFQEFRLLNAICCRSGCRVTWTDAKGQLASDKQKIAPADYKHPRDRISVPHADPHFISMQTWTTKMLNNVSSILWFLLWSTYYTDYNMVTSYIQQPQHLFLASSFVLHHNTKHYNW